MQKDIDELLKRALADQREALLKQFSAQEGSNPLFDFKNAMVNATRELGSRQQAEGEENRKVIAELRREVLELKERRDADERVAEEAERGTAKGRTFEELVHAVIDEIAAAQGDAAHHTGDSANESGSKKGDTVVEIGGALGSSLATIVFEAKNKRLSKNDAWTELNACMGERDAAFAVLVVAGEDKVPSGLEELTEYQGNKIIAVLDRESPDPLALRLVYRYVRARILADGRRRARGRRRRRTRRRRGGGRPPQARQPGPQVADQRHEQRQGGRRRVRRDGHRRRALPGADRGLGGRRGGRRSPARAAAARSASSRARGRPRAWSRRHRRRR